MRGRCCGDDGHRLQQERACRHGDEPRREPGVANARAVQEAEEHTEEAGSDVVQAWATMVVVVVMVVCGVCGVTPRVPVRSAPARHGSKAVGKRWHERDRTPAHLQG